MKYGVYGVSESSDRSGMSLLGAFAGLPPDNIEKILIETFDTEKEAQDRAQELNWPQGKLDRKGHDYFTVKKI